MQGSAGASGRGIRIAAELAVIIVGVLIALAADRWNQAREERVTEATYLGRFVAEIRDDSARASAYLDGRPSVIASLDSLVEFVDGGPPPGNLPSTTLAVASELTLNPAVTWSEIQASRSLDAISDPVARAALTTYYGSRERQLLMWSRQDSRGRDPFFDAVYRIGVFDPDEAFGSAGSLDLDAFRNSPGIRELLLAVGAGHYFQRQVANQLIRNANTALAVLE